MSRIAFLCVLLAALFARGQDESVLPAAPEMFIETTRDSVAIRGPVSSSAHESILNRIITERFGDRTADIELTEGSALPPGWALTTEMTLRALSETRNATATITGGGIRIKGVTTSAPGWQEAVARVEQSLLPGMSFTHDVVAIKPYGSINRQCIELFRTAMRGRKIEFEHGSAQLGTAAAPMLDELVQIASDCPSSTIAITGHTDGTGDEDGNLALSQARADAVAGYITASGIAGTRIEAIGVGSARPLVEEVDAGARQLNRRIEIDIRFP